MLSAERLYKGRNLGDAVEADIRINDVGVNMNQLNPPSYEVSELDNAGRQGLESIQTTIARANMPVPEYVEDELEV
ncbi:MAG: hypothetical protein ACPHL8_04090 [Flavobacteriales bacterium]